VKQNFFETRSESFSQKKSNFALQEFWSIRMEEKIALNEGICLFVQFVVFGLKDGENIFQFFLIELLIWFYPTFCFSSF